MATNIGTNLGSDRPNFPVTTSAFDGPDLQGVVFKLKSNNPGNPNAPGHTLGITSQTSVSINFAFIEGTWQGDGPNAHKVSGSLTDGAVSITCAWANGMNGANTLMGRITQVVTTIPVVPIRWQFTGNVVVTDGNGAVLPGSGPGAVSGEGSAPLVAA